MGGDLDDDEEEEEEAEEHVEDQEDEDEFWFGVFLFDLVMADDVVGPVTGLNAEWALHDDG